MNKKIVFGLIATYLVLGFFLAELLAGGLYFFANKTMPDNLTLDTWSTYWHFYSEDHTQRKRLQFAAGASGFIVFVLPFMILAPLFEKRRSLHGEARFARASEVAKAGLYGEKGIIVGKYNGSYLVYSGQEFVLLVAPTRSGKGVAVVIPNLLNFSDSLVVIDIKLENFKLTSKFRAENGQKVFLFNPFADDGRTHRWNPLDGIDRHQNHRVGDILAIGQVLYPNDNAKDAFWNDQARNLFLGLILFLLETPELPCTLGEVLRQSSGKGKPIKDHLTEIMRDRLNGDNPLSEDCLDALQRFVSTSENTMSSILATFNAPLTIFANPIVDAATSTSDFDISRVRKELMSIYIGVQPNRLADASLLINLFFSQLININTRELPENNRELKYQCLLINDEFTALGRVGIIAKANSFIAGYNLRLLTVIQSVSQLKSVYGDQDTKTLVTNHGMQIIYPPSEQQDANEYSEMLGYFTEKAVSSGVSRARSGFGGNNGSISENVSDQRRALMLPQELKEMPQDEQIIVMRSIKPILCKKARYYDDPAFIDRLKSVSKSLFAIGNRLPKREELTEAAYMFDELSISAPALDVDLHKAKVENRVRVLKPEDEIDVSKLTIDQSALPTISNPDSPSQEDVSGFVDAFFSQLEWVDTDTGEITANTAENEPINSVGEFHTHAAPTLTTKNYDLSVLSI